MLQLKAKLDVTQVDYALYSTLYSSGTAKQAIAFHGDERVVKANTLPFYIFMLYLLMNHDYIGKMINKRDNFFRKWPAKPIKNNKRDKNRFVLLGVCESTKYCWLNTKLVK